MLLSPAFSVLASKSEEISAKWAVINVSLSCWKIKGETVFQHSTVADDKC